VELSGKYQKNFTGIAPEAENLLKNHSWKGNIRELRNIIERCVLIEDGPLLHLNDLRLEKKNGRRPPPLAPGALQALPDDGLDFAAL
jgi:DNA-binding NtrC family response regulator